MAILLYQAISLLEATIDRLWAYIIRDNTWRGLPGDSVRGDDVHRAGGRASATCERVAREVREEPKTNAGASASGAVG
jgi:hypothetical protein